MKKYQVWSYDVWGNEIDGYTVKDRFGIGEISTSDDTDKTIINTLVADGYLTSNKNLEITDNGNEVLYIDSAIDGYPLLELVLVEDKPEEKENLPSRIVTQVYGDNSPYCFKCHANNALLDERKFVNDEYIDYFVCRDCNMSIPKKHVLLEVMEWDKFGTKYNVVKIVFGENY